MSLATNWSSWLAFVYMGGYGLYVWGAVLITFASLLCEAVALQLGHRRAVQGARDAARRSAREATL